MILLLTCLSSGMLLINNIVGQEIHENTKKVSYITKNYIKKSVSCQSDNSDVCATIHISYPFFVSTLGTRSAVQLNQYISEEHICYTRTDDQKITGIINFSQKFIDDYSDYIQNDQASSGNWEQNKKIEVIFLNENILSLQDTEDNYTGGAHSFTYKRLVSLDLNTGKILKLSDILKGSKAKNKRQSKQKLKKIAEQYFRQLHMLSKRADLAQAGFEFERNQFSLSKNFSVLKQGIVFYYNRDEVATYVVSTTRLFIPYEALVDVIDIRNIDP